MFIIKSRGDFEGFLVHFNMLYQIWNFEILTTKYGQSFIFQILNGFEGN